MQPDAPFATPPSLVPVFSRWFGSWRLSVERRPFAQRELAGHYDRRSGDWHRMLGRHRFEAAYQSLLGRVLRQHRYRQEAKTLQVLDVGIGTGAMSSALRDTLGRPFHLTGVDISAAMLAQAAARLTGEDISATFRQADLTSLPFADDAFDVVLAAHVIEHLPDPQRAVTELNRVLKPGGLLICCLTQTSATGLYVQLMWRTHRVAQSKAIGWLKDSGLRSVRAVPFDKQTAARRFSIGYVGRKPHA